MTCKRCALPPSTPVRELGDSRWPSTIAGYCLDCVWVIVQEWEQFRKPLIDPEDFRRRLKPPELTDPRLDATPRLTVRSRPGLFYRLYCWLFERHQNAPLDPEGHHKNHPIKSERDNG